MSQTKCLFLFYQISWNCMSTWDLVELFKWFLIYVSYRTIQIYLLKRVDFRHWNFGIETAKPLEGGGTPYNQL